VDPAPSPESRAPDAEPPVPSLWAARMVALIEVLICSEYPTQLALSATFVAFGYGPYVHGQLRIGYVVGVSLADAGLMIALVLLFLRAHGESPAAVLNGGRRVAGELLAGIPMIVTALAIGIAVLFLVQRFAPQLHTVPTNPLQSLLQSKRNALLLALVVIVAGGVREEIQRGFLLHRFDQWLGGGGLGVVLTSVAFGAGHLYEGLDASLATGLLGAFWGVVYLRRRSVVAPMVSHAGFDLLQIVQFLVIGR
jgi:membrane protease YdiL (CAAX protease family)